VVEGEAAMPVPRLAVESSGMSASTRDPNKVFGKLCAKVFFWAILVIKCLNSPVEEYFMFYLVMRK
jgi:hypothetical protein